MGHEAVRHEVQAAAGKERWIEVVSAQEPFQAQGAFGGRPESVQLVIVDDHVVAVGVEVAAANGARLDGAVHRALLHIADALAAIGVDLMAVGFADGGRGRIGFDRDGDEA